MVAGAEAEQAPGTGVGVESRLNSSVSLSPRSAFARLAPNALGDLGNSCLLSSPFPGGPQPATFLFYLPTSGPVSCLIITLPPTPLYSDVASKGIRVVADRDASLHRDWTRS